ncbi:HNH endonuclease [Bernardetia litoralis DSM 6794]|uniref:HNH endonuclease n=1 Tax=Bernardetia litoralis (strain ATCC 23117 / DSM 6794 / NBRC 15988 / NCIMB 1366 / Fx l1 / Sio-4) TaxID=880071 RepID=I4ALF9_BERLS|nr:HNH endonuclease [Bernardetia litoralis]AFM04794.1 HNH endonuclease [Bernardetia litoralis DSM 6794]
MAKSKRPSIPTHIKRSVMMKSLGVCCVCKERGLGTNLHHIDSNPFNNSEENIAVICVKEHDQHHRPNAYDNSKHLELGEDKIRELKIEWENTVAECQKENPKVIAVTNVYGTYENIHSVRFFLQNIEGKIIYERIYHLLTGTLEQWTDNIINEVVWLGEKVKLSIINQPLKVEYCPCCTKSLIDVLDKNVMIRLTANDWKEKSISTIYINPSNPSLALTIFYNEKLVFSCHLHKCNTHLHFVCDNYEERTPIKKQTNVRTQATEIINRIISTWEVERILIGTNNPDTPTLIDDFDLPNIWDK